MKLKSVKLRPISRNKARGKVHLNVKNDTNLFLGVAKHLLDRICERSKVEEE